jgi:brefeldin A-inhibited guanine nucleotide-exchange protein
METERDAFVSSMAKLTGLVHVGEMKPKNVKAIKTLIGLSLILGEYLDHSWIELMKVVSAVERLQQAWNSVGSSSGKPDQEISRPSSTVAEMGYSASSLRRSSTIARIDDLVTSLSTASPGMIKIMSELSSQSMDIAIDKIFSSTVSLSSNAIIHFFRALCAASLEEVGLESVTTGGSVPDSPEVHLPESIPFEGKSPVSPMHTGFSAMSGPPRMYCSLFNLSRFLLQKIVEIAYYNINRIRFEWSQIWRILQPHFNTVACHPSVPVATFAVDSLRQLSMKFLERDELSHYNTQYEFLKSFEWIMRYHCCALTYN